MICSAQLRLRLFKTMPRRGGCPCAVYTQLFVNDSFLSSISVTLILEAPINSWPQKWKIASRTHKLRQVCQGTWTELEPRFDGDLPHIVPKLDRTIRHRHLGFELALLWLPGNVNIKSRYSIVRAVWHNLVRYAVKGWGGSNRNVMCR
jgi:hypothetical protein